MEKPSFYSKLWRFNAVVIALAGMGALLLIIIGLIALTVDFFGDMRRGASDNNIIDVENIEETTKKLSYGNPILVDGTDYMRVPLETFYDETYSASSYGGTVTSTHNFLFYNLQTNDHHWLLDHHGYVMTSTTLGTQQAQEFIEEDDARKPVMAYAYKVIKADTNDDKKLTEDDLITYALSTPDGKGYVELLEDIDAVIENEYLGNNRFAVVYKKSSGIYIATVDTRQRRLLSNVSLPDY